MKQGISRFQKKTQAVVRELNLDVKEKTANLPRQWKTSYDDFTTGLFLTYFHRPRTDGNNSSGSTI